MKEPKVAFVNNKVYRYIFNVHSVTKSGFSIKKYEDTLFFLNRKMEYIREIRPDYLEKMYNLFVKCHMNLLQNMCRTSGSEWHWRKKLSISEFRKYKKYFIPQTRQDRKMYFVLSHNLYNIYCILLSLRARK